MMKHSPRGWNSWDCYGPAVNEEIVRRNAKYMAENMKDAGYEYVVVDIQWYEPLAETHAYHPFADVCMDEYGRLLPAENRFPSAKDGKGFKPLADYVHSLGLKFGIHIMRGMPRQAVSQNVKIMGTDISARYVAKTNSICAWNTDMYGVDTEKPGGKEYYESIFSLYASWGVDFIKCDDICRELPHEEKELVALSEALKGCGREMVLSLSPGPAILEKAELYKQISNMWRITDDFWDDWKLLYNMFERAEKWSIHAGNNHFPDCDMLPVGALRQCYSEKDKTKFTEDEQRTMMILWSIVRSPLMTGNELTKMDNFTLGLLTDKRLMEMHEKSRHAHMVFRRIIDGNEITLWIAAKKDGGMYFAVFNLGEGTAEVKISLDELEAEGPISAIEMFTEERKNFDKVIELEIASHAARAFEML